MAQVIPPPPRLAGARRRPARRPRFAVLLTGRPATAVWLWRAIGYAIVGGLLWDGVGYAPFGDAVSHSPGLAALRQFPGLHVHGLVQLMLGLALWHQLARDRQPRLLLGLIVGYSIFVFCSDVASWFVTHPATIAWGVPGKPGGVIVLGLIMAFARPVDTLAPRPRSGPGDGAH